MKQLKKILLILLVVMYLLLLMSQFNRVLLLHPKQDAVITERQPEFRWTAGYPYYVLLLNDKENMEYPIVKIVLEENRYRIQQQLNFEPYYWQVIGIDEDGKLIASKKNRFVVQSLVALETKQDIRNVGNVPLKIENREDNKLTGHTILDVREILYLNLTNKSFLLAEQYE